MKPIDPITFNHFPEVHEKGWGREIWIANNEKYCGKILEFNKGAEFSMHYHMLKHETFYILEGKIELRGYDLSDASPRSEVYAQGTVITIPAGNPHKIIALEKSRVIEVSTQHFESDSYRIIPGNSQKK
jgi:quercetin dioxygenase-like cupin family protein